MKFIVDRFLLLPIGAAIALIWANTAGESYFRFAHALAFPVNEIGMALFLGLLAQETFDALLPGGVLHRCRRWSVPLIAAAGGVAGSVLTYLAYVHVEYELVLVQAWPVACAIDMAVAYYVVRWLLPKSVAIPFVLVLAVATNAFGLLVVSLRAGVVDMHPAGPLLILAAVAGAALLKNRGVRSNWLLIGVCGTASWAGFHLAGLHPALAIIPIVPFLPHEARRNIFADPPDDDAVHHFEHQWNGLVQAVLFLFGLVNAGVLLQGQDTGTWAILTAAVIGRPVGILAGVAVAHWAGLPLPGRMGWRELIVVALATSSGFTFALFFASGFLPVGAVLTQVKYGALLSVLGAVAAFVAARLLLSRRESPASRTRLFASQGRY